MGRPRTPIGTYGGIKTVGYALADKESPEDPDRWIIVGEGSRAAKWRARTKFRDTDGVLRDVEAWAPTKARAETDLRAKLKDRQAPRRGDLLSHDSAFMDAVWVWYAQAERDRATSTVTQYDYVIEAYVVGSPIANLTLREVNNVATLERYVQYIADGPGPGSAKSAKSVVSGVLTLAARYGLLDFNAMRDVRGTGQKKNATPKSDRDTQRAFTRDERDFLVAFAASHEATQSYDVADFIAFMAGTGVRISEALRQRWEDVDFESGKIMVRGTKTSGSTRLITAPRWLLDRMSQRAEVYGADGVVFHSPGTDDREKPRDRRNVYRKVRLILDEAGFPWATSHSFRRTVASLIDGAGESVALAADVLGHKDASMTARYYLGRRGDTARAAAVL